MPVVTGVEAPEASPGHLDEGLHGVAGAEGVLDGPEEVGGLEDEDHLSVDKSEDVGDLTDIALGVLLDLTALERTKWLEDKRQ